LPPASTDGLGVAALTIVRLEDDSGPTGTSICVVTVDVLLLEFGSVWLPATVTVFVRLPLALELTLTTIFVVSTAPTARLPSWTESLPLLLVTVPWPLDET